MKRQNSSCSPKQSIRELFPTSLPVFALEMLHMRCCVPVQPIPKWGNDSSKYSWPTLQAFPSVIQHCLLLNVCQQQLLKLLNSLSCVKIYFLHNVLSKSFTWSALLISPFLLTVLKSGIFIISTEAVWAANVMLYWYCLDSPYCPEMSVFQGISFALLQCLLHLLPFQKLTVLPYISLSFRDCRGKPGFVLFGQFFCHFCFCLSELEDYNCHFGYSLVKLLEVF